MDDEFNDGSGMSGPVNGLNARWSWLNQGGASVSFASDCAKILAPSGAGNNPRILAQNAPAGSWEVRAKVALMQNPHLDLPFNYPFAGLMARTSGGTIYLVGLTYNSGEKVTFQRYSAYTTYAATLRDYGMQTMSRFIYLSFQYISGTGMLVASFSVCGLPGTFFSIGDESMTPQTVGIFAESNHAGNSATGFVSWFRRIS